MGAYRERGPRSAERKGGGGGRNRTISSLRQPGTGNQGREPSHTLYPNRKKLETVRPFHRTLFAKEEKGKRAMAHHSGQERGKWQYRPGSRKE